MVENGYSLQNYPLPIHYRQATVVLSRPISATFVSDRPLENFTNKPILVFDRNSSCSILSSPGGRARRARAPGLLRIEQLESGNLFFLDVPELLAYSELNNSKVGTSFSSKLGYLGSSTG